MKKSKALTSLQFARLCRRCAEEKKATDILILDLRGISSFTDYFVICSAQSEPQLKAIVNEIIMKVREDTPQSPLGRDGAAGSSWLVLDYGDVVVHAMLEKTRAHYDIESFWNDAPRRR
jgi:ribosome-associated protein